MATMNVYALRKSSLGSDSGILHHVVYTDRRVAKAKAEDMHEEFVSWEVVHRPARVISDDEVAIDRVLFTLHKTPAKEDLKQRALRKLSADERESLGYSPKHIWFDSIRLTKNGLEFWAGDKMLVRKREGTGFVPSHMFEQKGDYVIEVSGIEGFTTLVEE
jgi:hypothetical protein